MKITSVELHPEGSDTVVELSFRDPGATNRFNVIGITGLDADEIVPKQYFGGTNQTFHNMSVNRKEIAIKMKLNPSWSDSESYSDLRDELYRMIQSSRTGNVQIQFKNADVVVAAISGLIIKFEAPTFEKDQQVTLTLRCDYPLLQAPDRVELDVETLDPDLIVIEDSLSTMQHGFTMQLHTIDDITSFSIAHPDGDWEFVVNAEIDDNKMVYFSSEHDSKYLYWVNVGGYHINVADNLASGYVWPMIFPGENGFVLSNSADIELVAISYYPTYWGV